MVGREDATFLQYSMEIGDLLVWEVWEIRLSGLEYEVVRGLCGRGGNSCSMILQQCSAHGIYDIWAVKMWSTVVVCGR